MTYEDVVVEKLPSIQRSVKRARDEYASAGLAFDIDFTKQDAAVLNVLRACELSIDLANLTANRRKLGIPSSSADSFQLMARAQIIDQALAGRLENMVSFRSLIVHQYKEANLEFIKLVISVGLDDLIVFGDKLKLYWEQMGSPQKSAPQQRRALTSVSDGELRRRQTLRAAQGRP